MEAHRQSVSGPQSRDDFELREETQVGHLIDHLLMITRAPHNSYTFLVD